MRKSYVRLLFVLPILVAFILSACVPIAAPHSGNAPDDSSLPTSASGSPPSLSSADQAIATRIDLILTKLTAEGIFTGTALIAHNDQILLRKGYGLADREQPIPNAPTTRFRIIGLTKSFTSLAILLLQAQGKLKVADPVCQYITDCPPSWQPMTIHQLLTNSAGLYDFRDYTYTGQSPPAPSTSLQVLNRVKDQPLDFIPGEDVRFSNGGFIVAGYLIEQVSGQSYEQFLQEQIFTPLGLLNTGYAHDDSTLAVGYRDTINKDLPIDGSLPFASSGLYSTVDDLYLYTQALMGGQFLSAESLSAFWGQHVSTGEDNGGFTPGYGQPSYYGYGWAVATFKGHRLIGHDGGIAGYGSDLRLYPDDGFTMILLANQKVWAAEIGDLVAHALFVTE